MSREKYVTLIGGDVHYSLDQGRSEMATPVAIVAELALPGGAMHEHDQQKGEGERKLHIARGFGISSSTPFTTWTTKPRTWIRISDPPDGKILSFAVDGDGGLFAGTFEGVYYSPDHGEAWEWRNARMNSWSVVDIVVDQGGNLLVSTSRCLSFWARPLESSIEHLKAMVNPTKELADLEARHTRDVVGSRSYQEALRIFQAMWDEAGRLNPEFPSSSWEDDVAPDITLARVLNGPKGA